MDCENISIPCYLRKGGWRQSIFFAFLFLVFVAAASLYLISSEKRLSILVITILTGFGVVLSFISYFPMVYCIKIDELGISFNKLFGRRSFLWKEIEFFSCGYYHSPYLIRHDYLKLTCKVRESDRLPYDYTFPLYLYIKPKALVQRLNLFQQQLDDHSIEPYDRYIDIRKNNTRLVARVYVLLLLLFFLGMWGLISR